MARDNVTFLGRVADDELPPTIISDSVRLLEQNPDAGFSFGDLTFFNQGGVSFLKVQGDSDYQRVVRRTMPRVNHPTFLVRRSVYERYGAFENRWRIAMDYDWLLRVTRAGVRGVYSSTIHTRMQTGGNSDQDLVKTLNEERLISIHHGRGRMSANAYFLMRVVRLWVRLLLQPILPARFIALVRPGKQAIDVTASEIPSLNNGFLRLHGGPSQLVSLAIRGRPVAGGSHY